MTVVRVVSTDAKACRIHRQRHRSRPGSSPAPIFAAQPFRRSAMSSLCFRLHLQASSRSNVLRNIGDFRNILSCRNGLTSRALHSHRSTRPTLAIATGLQIRSRTRHGQLRSTTSSSNDRPNENESKSSLRDLRENIYTLPNALTVSRILSCPFLAYFIVQGNFELATAALVYAGVTDLVIIFDKLRKLKLPTDTVNS